MLKVKAFVYYFIIYMPIGFIGIIAVFSGNFIFKNFPYDFFTVSIGGSIIIFGVATFLVSLTEPYLKLIAHSEAVNSPFMFKEVDVSSHPKENAVGVKISPDNDLVKVADEIIENECNLLGRPYCLKIVRNSGFDIDDAGRIKHLSKDYYGDLEKIIGAYVKAFGKPALYTAQVVLSKYPDIKFVPIYKTI